MGHSNSPSADCRNNRDSNESQPNDVSAKSTTNGQSHQGKPDILLAAQEPDDESCKAMDNAGSDEYELDGESDQDMDDDGSHEDGSSDASSEACGYVLQWSQDGQRLAVASGARCSLLHFSACFS